MSVKMKKTVNDAILYLLLIAFAAFFIFPLIWMFFTALKSPNDLLNTKQIMPEIFVWENFSKALGSFPFVTYLKNSVVIVSLTILGTLFASTTAAYAFAKLKWPGRDVFFFIMIALMMLPSQITLIPLFSMYARMRILNTYIPLVLPPFFAVGGSMYVFLLRQFFQGIPGELTESAIIDGANHFTVFSRIILPLARPALVTVVLFTFTFTWNDFFYPIIYLTDQIKYTLPVGLRMFATQYEFKYNLMMAAALVVMIPTLVVFFLAQKQFVEGISFSGIKG